MAGLILESGAADPGKRFLSYADLARAGLQKDQVLAEVRRYFDHQQKLAAYAGPLLILHTDHDSLINIAHAQRNLKWAGSSHKRLVRFPVGDHNSILTWNRRECLETVARFARELEEL